MNRIILVDDEKHILRGMKLLISRLGEEYEVCETFNNAKDALDFIRREDVDIIITDISMPEMTGLELIHEAKEIKPDIKCVILSGYNDFEYARAAIKMSVADYLLKPVDDASLKEVLERISGQEENLTSKIGIITSDELSKDTEFIIKEIENHYKDFSLTETASKINRSTDYVSRVFAKETGVHINDYLREVRMFIARKLLSDNENLMIYEVSEMVGYSDPVYFAKQFKKVTGVNPKDYSKAITSYH